MTEPRAAVTKRKEGTTCQEHGTDHVARNPLLWVRWSRTNWKRSTRRTGVSSVAWRTNWRTGRYQQRCCQQRAPISTPHAIAAAAERSWPARAGGAAATPSRVSSSRVSGQRRPARVSLSSLPSIFGGRWRDRPRAAARGAWARSCGVCSWLCDWAWRRVHTAARRTATVATGTAVLFIIHSRDIHIYLTHGA